jgi:hypothetical protein
VVGLAAFSGPFCLAWSWFRQNGVVTSRPKRQMHTVGRLKNKSNCMKRYSLTQIPTGCKVIGELSELKQFERFTLKYKVYMNNSNTHNQRIAKMTFASVYPMYLEKVEKKGRTKEELHQVIEWLTGFDNKKLQELIKENATFEIFFQHASLNPNAHLITGVICGYRVEEIEDTLTQQVRYLDKLVDELAKGRKMEKILRGS